MLSERALQSIIQTRLTEALGQESSALKGARVQALQRYRGEPDGREREGHSQVVWRDVAESVDSVMPQLMKIFAGSEQIGQFQPHGPEDEAGAAQATDYVNWIWSSQNNGPMILHHWLKDGLLQRLGVIKVWWDRAERRRRETYRGLTQEELQALELGEEDTVAWHEERLDSVVEPNSGQTVALPPLGPVPPDLDHAEALQQPILEPVMQDHRAVVLARPDPVHIIRRLRRPRLVLGPMRLELPDLLAAGKDLHQLRHDRIHGFGHVAPDHLGMALALAPVCLAAIALQRRDPRALERARLLPQRLGQARLNDGLKSAVGEHGSRLSLSTHAPSPCGMG